MAKATAAPSFPTETADTGETRPAGLLDFQRRRKAGSRERLLAAAAEAFCITGYLAVSMEDIASAAGVSRMTVYRHFSGKAAIALELFRQATAARMPDYLAIGARDYQDRDVVAGWIAHLFAADRKQRRMLKVFAEANVEASFTEPAQAFIGELIADLGHSIPAFAIDADDPVQRRLWIEAWLLLYELLDQSNHAARDSGVATDPLIIDVLAARFIHFARDAG